MTRLICIATGNGEFTGLLPNPTSPGWHLVVARVPRQASRWMLSLRTSAAGAVRMNEYLLAKPARFNLFGIKLGIIYVPPGQSHFMVTLHSRRAAPDRLVLDLLQLPRLLTSLLLPLQNFPVFWQALATAEGTPPRRLRVALTQVGISGPSFPSAYRDWISCFDIWPPGMAAARLGALAQTGVPAIGIMVLHAGPAGPALQQTLESLRLQVLLPRVVVIAGPDGPDEAEEAGLRNVAYVAVLQAGEVIPPHSLLVLAEALCCEDPPLILLADEDRLTNGARTDPFFKPEPSLTMMCSGKLATGVWLIRSDLLDGLGERAHGWAECLRLRAWFRAYGNGSAGKTHRIAAVLTHRSAGTEAAPEAVLAGVVEGFLAEAGFSAEVVPAVPLRVHWHPGALAKAKVSLLVPSRLEGRTQLDCILAVLQHTDHPNFEMLVVVAQDVPLSLAQSHAAEQLLAFPNVRVELVRQSSFNFSEANNIAAMHTDGEFLCLLNDDVAPLESDWLDRLLGFFQDPACGIAGPRLLYPNHLTQHGGVIIGLAGLVEHANRFVPHEAPGYAGRAGLDQEYSAVTGACLLVRRSVFDGVGGLDEAYPTAFNDIDFCLRVRQQGFGVVYAGSVDMIHHESLTFGRHYDPADQDNPDIERFRAQWSATVVNDPFHNPNLSLKLHSEWQLAFPPRPEPG